MQGCRNASAEDHGKIYWAGRFWHIFVSEVSQLKRYLQFAFGTKIV